MPHHGFPLVTPFKTTTEQQLVLWNGSIKPKDVFASDRINYDASTNRINIPCTKCGQSQNYSIPELETAFTHALEHDAHNHIRVVVLTDCSNAHASVHSIQPRSTDKSTKIVLGYIRDYLSYLCLTFIDAGFNLADTGTKTDANKGIWLSFIETNEFRIGFVGRKLYRELKEAQILF